MATDLSLAFTTWVDHPGTPSVPGAADLNRLQTNDRFLANRPAMVLNRDIDQEIPNGTLTAVVFRSARLDSEDGHPAANGSLSTMTVKMSGYYDLRAFVMWNAPLGGATPSGWRSLRIMRRNASQSVEAPLWRVDQPALPTANAGMGQSIAAPLTLLYSGEHVRVAVAHNQGSTLYLGSVDYDAAFSMIWVRQP